MHKPRYRMVQAVQLHIEQLGRQRKLHLVEQDLRLVVEEVPVRMVGVERNPARTRKETRRD